MNHSKVLFATMIFAVAIFTTALTGFGQADPRAGFDQSYEVMLQVVTASNDAPNRNDLPANLSAISKELKTNFSFSNYHVATTLLGRVYDNGTVEYKSVTNGFVPDYTPGSQTFLEWTINNFRNVPGDKGQPGVRAEGFRFGARVPVITSNVKTEGGTGMPAVINYEAIGLTLRQVGLTQNVPTLLGTLSLPGTTGTIFLVVTVRPVS